MTRIAFSQLIAGALFSLCLATVPARALNDRTYVSVKGADTGGCFSAAPCRNFAFAIAQTAAGGEIIVIDPANYGPVTITKSISIVADGGGPAGIYITTGTAITISSGGGIIVNLRGLTLDGAGTAVTGIFAAGSGSVTITDCFIRHFKGDGIAFAGIGGFISNTVSADSDVGLSAVGIGTSFKGVVDHFTATGNRIGILLASRGGSIELTIADSVIAANFEGLCIGCLDRSFATATLAGSVVTKNGVGVQILPDSTVFSYGDNEINGNTTDVLGTLTPLAKK